MDLFEGLSRRFDAAEGYREPQVRVTRRQRLAFCDTFWTCRLMYSCIRPADYMTHLRRLLGPNRVAEACAVTSNITYWVMQEVLQSESVQQRGNVLKIFLTVTHVGCRHLSAFEPEHNTETWNLGLLSEAQFLIRSCHCESTRFGAHPTPPRDTQNA